MPVLTFTSASTTTCMMNSVFVFLALEFLQKFLCGGRLVFGPDAGSVILSTVLIGGPALTFCIKMLLKISEVDFLYGRIVLTGGFFLTFLVGKLNLCCICKGLQFYKMERVSSPHRCIWLLCRP